MKRVLAFFLLVFISLPVFASTETMLDLHKRNLNKQYTVDEHGNYRLIEDEEEKKKDNVRFPAAKKDIWRRDHAYEIWDLGMGM